MNIGVVFGQMLVLLAMMAVGFFCYKKSWVTDETAGHLSKLVVNIFNPILVVNGVLGQRSGEDGNSIAWNLAFIVLYFVLLMIIGYVMPVILRPSENLKSIYRLMTIFANVGFMGIPVGKSIFGDGAMIYIAFYILGYNIMLYTCGMYLSKKAGEERRVFENPYQIPIPSEEGKELSTEDEMRIVSQMLSMDRENKTTGFLRRLINPGVVAALLAVIIFAFGMELPGAVVTFCDYMGNATIPLSMVMIGISMAQSDLREVFTDKRIYVFIALRLVALPIIATLLLKGFVAAYAVNPIVFGVFIVELGMPVGSIIVMLTRENGGDAAYCTRGVVLSTLASIVTIPLICAFL